MFAWNNIKGYLAGIVALIACPCHLPITLPLLISLMAGTALGAWLENNAAVVAGLSTIVFVGGLILAFKWLARDPAVAAPPSSEPVEVILVTSRTCQTCGEAARFWEALRATHPFRYRQVDITSGKGRSLAAHHNILTTPTTLINGRVAFRGMPSRLRATLAVKR